MEEFDINRIPFILEARHHLTVLSQVQKEFEGKTWQSFQPVMNEFLVFEWISMHDIKSRYSI